MYTRELNPFVLGLLVLLALALIAGGVLAVRYPERLVAATSRRHRPWTTARARFVGFANIGVGATVVIAIVVGLALRFVH